MRSREERSRMHPGSYMAVDHHQRLLSLRPVPNACRLQGLCRSTSRQAPARLLPGTPPFEKPRNGTGGVGMSQQERQETRRNMYRAPQPAQRNTGDEDDDNAYYTTRPH